MLWISEAYSELCQTSKSINYKPLTIFDKTFILIN